MIDRSAKAHMIAPAPSTEPIDSTDAAEPIEPIDSTEPTDPIESTEPLLPMHSTESCDLIDHLELPASIPPSWPVRASRCETPRLPAWPSTPPPWTCSHIPRAGGTARPGGTSRRSTRPAGPRNLATCVAFLLEPGQRSAWHRVTSDELWLWQGGGPMLLTVGGFDESPVAGFSVELREGGQYLVRAGEWQSAEPATDDASLVACVVAPGLRLRRLHTGRFDGLERVTVQ